MYVPVVYLFQDFVSSGRQLFRSLHDMTENDFDEDAMKIYEARQHCHVLPCVLPCSDSVAMCCHVLPCVAIGFDTDSDSDVCPSQ